MLYIASKIQKKSICYTNGIFSLRLLGRLNIFLGVSNKSPHSNNYRNGGCRDFNNYLIWETSLPD